jgi:imidazolonepropionase-like amidohydrolase
MHDASVVIRGDRITAISHSKSAAAPGGESNVEVIDGTGLYLSPGLIDSHVHNCSHLHKGHRTQSQRRTVLCAPAGFPAIAELGYDYKLRLISR